MQLPSRYRQVHIVLATAPYAYSPLAERPRLSNELSASATGCPKTGRFQTGCCHFIPCYLALTEELVLAPKIGGCHADLSMGVDVLQAGM
jgi:hypothetical protein